MLPTDRKKDLFFKYVKMHPYDVYKCASCGALICEGCVGHILTLIKICPKCGTRATGIANFKKVNFRQLSTEERGYYVKGTAFCESCRGAMMATIEEIPVEFRNLECPNCGRKQFKIVPYSIHRLRSNCYTFRARIICKNKMCHMSTVTTSFFRGLLSNIKRVVISVKEGKIEVEKFGNS